VKKIAFFDFDGTITTKNTLLEVIKFQKGSVSLYTGLLINTPYLAAYKVKIISNQLAKEKILKYFFEGMDFTLFQQACNDFADKALPAIIRPEAIAEIEKLKASGFEIVVVSASAESWIKKWSDTVGATLIASKLEVKDNKITGNIAGRNCNGSEKASRIKSAYDLSQYNEIYSYGDSKGDKAMLALATKPAYKPFREY
jgi:phosphatidylglycerophosphatase C